MEESLLVMSSYHSHTCTHIHISDVQLDSLAERNGPGACGFLDVSTSSYAPFPNKRIAAPNQWIYYGFAGEEEFCKVSLCPQQNDTTSTTTTM